MICDRMLEKIPDFLAGRLDPHAADADGDDVEARRVRAGAFQLRAAGTI